MQKRERGIWPPPCGIPECDKVGTLWGRIFTVVLHGEQLQVERLCDAHKDRVLK